jgi:hypothetical protein
MQCVVAFIERRLSLLILFIISYVDNNQWKKLKNAQDRNKWERHRKNFWCQHKVSNGGAPDNIKPIIIILITDTCILAYSLDLHKILKGLRNFIKLWKQSWIYGSISEAIPVNFGVRQGSVVHRRLFFLLYINGTLTNFMQWVDSLLITIIGRFKDLWEGQLSNVVKNRMRKKTRKTIKYN